MTNRPVKDIVEAVDIRSRQFEENFSSQDAYSLVENYYTDDPIVSGDGVGIVVGRQGVLQYFEQIFRVFKQCKFERKVVSREGNMAYELGNVTLLSKNTEERDTTLRYSVVWKWQDGDGWRAEVDYFALITE